MPSLLHPLALNYLDAVREQLVKSGCPDAEREAILGDLDAHLLALLEQATVNNGGTPPDDQQVAALIDELDRPESFALGARPITETKQNPPPATRKVSLARWASLVILAAVAMTCLEVVKVVRQVETSRNEFIIIKTFGPDGKVSGSLSQSNPNAQYEVKDYSTIKVQGYKLTELCPALILGVVVAIHAWVISSRTYSVGKKSKKLAKATAAIVALWTSGVYLYVLKVAPKTEWSMAVGDVQEATRTITTVEPTLTFLVILICLWAGAYLLWADGSREPSAA